MKINLNEINVKLGSTNIKNDMVLTLQLMAEPFFKYSTLGANDCFVVNGIYNVYNSGEHV